MLPVCQWCSRHGGTSGTDCTESSGILPDFPWGRKMKSQGFHLSASAHWRHPVAGQHGFYSILELHGKHRHPVIGWQWCRDRLGCDGHKCPTCCRFDRVPSRRLSRITVDQRGGAHAHERATEASEAWRAKRSGRAVNEGLDGLSERQASGRGHLRAAAADFTDCSRSFSAFR